MRDISFTAPSNSACSIVEGTHTQTLCIAATQTPTQPPLNKTPQQKSAGKLTHSTRTFSFTGPAPAASFAADQYFPFDANVSCVVLILKCGSIYGIEGTCCLRVALDMAPVLCGGGAVMRVLLNG